MDVGNHLPEIYHKVEVVQTDLEIFQWSNPDGPVCVWGEIGRRAKLFGTNERE